MLVLSVIDSSAWGQTSATRRRNPLPDEQTGYDNHPFWTIEAKTDWEPIPRDEIRKTILGEAALRRSRWRSFSPLDDAKLKEQGIRKEVGKYITFYTDLSPGELTDRFVDLLDAETELLFDYFGLEKNETKPIHFDAFLMGKPELFQKAGILDGVPEFQAGYSMADRIWAIHQGGNYYNRFLLMHELVHSFVNEKFGALRPRWFSEGLAEHLALYRIEGDELQLGINPQSPDEVPGFNRIGIIRLEIQTGKAPSFDQILRFGPSDYETTSGYAWSWALVRFLVSHPRYQPVVAKMPYYMMAPDPGARFKQLLGNDYQTFERDWDDFVTGLDYNYDFTASVIDYEKGKPLPETEDGREKIVNVVANKSWQSSLIRLEAGKKYQIRGAGRIQLFDPRAMIPSEIFGVTCEYFNDRPRGELLLAILPEGTRKKDAPVWCDLGPVSTAKTFTPSISGTLYFKINDKSDARSKNKGAFQVKIREI